MAKFVIITNFAINSYLKSLGLSMITGIALTTQNIIAIQANVIVTKCKILIPEKTSIPGVNTTINSMKAKTFATA